ncbi:hypothetical protein HPB49_022861 [Dermacentor silvarum]|uniref:Uncharacterized protein n=1 Tax=Dermacentor silvarum TaxID=543639 RepID=A0ACB8E3R6_DERSI|nr:hypothetical protein HPB49_022861 [Dermacentor silvarum]
MCACFCYAADRKKDLVKLQFGEYVSLGKVETTLKTHPLVDNVCVYGSSLSTFVVALIQPNEAALKQTAKSLSIPENQSLAQLCENPILHNAVANELSAYCTKSLTTSTPVAGGGGAAKLNTSRSVSAPLNESMQPIEIDGEYFREDDANDGAWNLVQRKSTGRKKTDAFEFLNRPRIAQDGGRVGAKNGRRIPALRRKVFAASRMPELPEEHQKIIVRPRNGLDLRKASHYGVSTAIFRAAGISSMEAETDVVCPNVVTEKESNAKKLLRIKSILVNGKEHEVNVYAAAGDGDVAMTQQGWVQPFTMGGSPILPATATWADRPPPPQTTRARQQQLQKEESAAPKSQVSGGSLQEQKRESEELEKIKEENAQLRELVGEMRKEMAELRAAISAPRQERIRPAWWAAKEGR